jgi:hypothetical protein
VSAIVTRYYFPRIVQVEKIVDRVVDRIVDRVVEVPVEKIVEKIVYVDKPAPPTSTRPRLLSAEERREIIRARRASGNNRNGKFVTRRSCVNYTN